MVFRPERSLLRVEVPNLHTIDTTSVENLFGMWSLFSKTSHAMQDGKRLENLSWRLWNRETFCCAPESPSHKRFATSNRRTSSTKGMPMPGLSSSLDSASEEDDDEFELSSPTTPRNCPARPELSRNDSTNESVTSRGREKHLTPVHLEKIVVSITETKTLEPIELPMATPVCNAREPPSSTTASQVLSKLELTSSQTPVNQTPHASESQATLLDSTSTVDTQDSNVSPSSQSSQESSSTEMSTHSIVRGFVPGGAPSSYRSQTNLAAQPTPILKTSPSYRQPPPKKKGPMFTIGTSSGEEESSLESHMHRSVLSDGLRAPGSQTSNGSQKHASFKDEVSVARAAARHSPVFESDDEEDDVSESAIEDDDDSSDWEDSDDGSGPSSVNERDLFQRVDSRPNLTSRRSLLTTLMHEPDRAKALANAASRSTPAIRRSRTTTPNGPSVATSPVSGSHLQLQVPGQEFPRSKPIIMTTSNTHQQLALSPRTTRRNMLSTELTESLRKNLLWERQHKSTGNLAALKRRHTSNDVKNLKQHPEPGPVLSHQGPKGRFTNDYFHVGLGEYHQKGW
ncbi:Putative nitrogen regulatory protein areA, GATA [Septoria linicola]|uniref:Nitrogen regulatory protein areA, GATA n=1 Tax=Septoria linicola TaxID=215465 RepID=A0A9Q9EEA0_9PEZI|nr:Putative nitrogen regulatory protein areA, GATA [Septoria linicola]